MANYSPVLGAIITAGQSLAQAVQSIRAPGTEGYAAASHAIDLYIQAQNTLTDLDAEGPVKDLQADARTTVTANPGTDERLSEILAEDPHKDKVEDNGVQTPASVEANAAAQGVDVVKVPGTEGKDAAPEAKPAPEPDKDAKLNAPKPTNATGAVGVKSSGSGA